MGRKKKDDDKTSLLALVAILAPIATIVGYFYYNSKIRKITKYLSGSQSDFWLSKELAEEYKEKYFQYQQVTKVVKNLEQTGLEANLSINKNGTFSKHNQLGKEIMTKLDEYLPIQVSLSNKLSLLSTLPQVKWKQFNADLRKKISFQWAFVVWLGTFTLFEVFQDFNIGSILMLSSLSTVLAFFSVYSSNKHPAEDFTPFPSQVSVENVDQMVVNQDIVDEEESTIRKVFIVLVQIYGVFFIIYHLYKFFNG